MVAALEEPLAAGLYLTATPIGHLQDMSLRAISVLSRASLIAAEDTRHSAKLLQHYQIKTDMMSYHDHNGGVVGPKIARMIEDGKSIALISDAGTPLISDPGYKLARLVRKKGCDVFVVPGASSLTAALSLSGLPTDRFFFEGFLPSKQVSRSKRIGELGEINSSIIIFESVKRIERVTQELLEVMGPRDAVLLRELTKLNEEVIALPLGELSAMIGERSLKGELVLVIGPPLDREIDDEQILSELSEKLSDGMSVRDSVAGVVEELSQSRGRVYDLALKIKQQSGEEQ